MNINFKESINFILENYIWLKWFGAFTGKKINQL